MGRKPLPTKYHDKGMFLGGPAGAIDRLNHVTVIGKCLLLWSEIDVQISLLLGEMIGAGTEATIAIYLALKQGRAKQQVIKAVADVVLDDKAKGLFAAILVFYESLEAERTPLAHGCFGQCAALPNSILWIDPTDFAVWYMGIRTKDFSSIEGPLGIFGEVAKKTYHYTLKDLLALYGDMERLYGYLFQFGLYLRSPLERDRIYDGLCAEPRIRTALSGSKKERASFRKR